MSKTIAISRNEVQAMKVTYYVEVPDDWEFTDHDDLHDLAGNAMSYDEKVIDLVDADGYELVQS